MEEKITGKTPLPRPITDPEAFFSRLFRAVPKHIRLCFVSSVFLGLVVHMYMFTNKFLNHDDLGHLFGSDYGAASGRWLLPWVLKLDGDFSLPWLIGVLSVLMLALSACLIVSVMKLRRPLSVVITSALVVSFPPVASTFAYMFSADAYFLGLALACLAAYLTDRYPFGFLGGVAAITLSLGIYQGYFGVAAFLMLGALVLYTLEGEMPIRDLLLRALRSFAALAGALVIYFVIVKITSLKYPLVDYMGISNMGHINPADIPRLVLSAYREYIHFFLYNSNSVHFGFLKYAFLLTAAATVFLIVLTGIRERLSPIRWLLLAFLAAIFPLAGNLIFLMAADTLPHMLMLYGMLGVLIAPLAVTDASYARSTEHTGSVFHTLSALCCWVIVLTLSISAYSYAVFSNEAYLKMDLSYRQAYAYSNRLLSAIESSEDYAAGVPIVLVGSELGAAYEPTPELDGIELTGVMDMKHLLTAYTYDNFLKRFLGVSGEIYDTQSELSQQFACRAEVECMRCYPGEGFIQKLDGYLVVKLG